MQVICVAGQLCMGKDVVCDYLVNQLNILGKYSLKQEFQPWERASFANGVKKIYEMAFGVDRQFIEHWKRNPDPPEGMLKNVRQSLQFIGDGFRQIRNDIWIDLILRDDSQKICISDGRYINEAKAVQEKKGISILLYRSGYLNDDPNPSESQLKPLLAWAVDNLPEGPIVLSLEQQQTAPEGLQFFDYFLVNDGTIQDLFSKIDSQLIPFVVEKYPFSC